MTQLARLLDHLLNRSFRVSQIAAIVSGSMILIMAFVIAIDITGRAFFDWTFQGADEFAGYTLAITCTIALTHALFHKRHIRVDSALIFLKKWRSARSAMDVVAMAALAVFIFPLTVLGIRVLLDSWNFGSRANTIIEVPLIYPQIMWVFGLVFFALTIFFMLVRSIMALFSGDLATVNKLVGMRSEGRGEDDSETSPESDQSTNTPQDKGGQ